jgi:lysophospholipase L1-like esterase
MNVVNKGIPGGALVANTQIYNALMSTTDGKVNADLITIEVGANDASAPLGEVTSMDTTTFCGALNTCLKNVLYNCPKAQVVLMPSTRGRYNSSGQSFALDYKTAGGYTMFERDEAIRQVAEANGIYFIPFGTGLGLGLFRMQSSALYNVDNIHHTELGGYNLAQGVWSYLKNIPLWYNSIPAN